MFLPFQLKPLVNKLAVPTTAIKKVCTIDSKGSQISGVLILKKCLIAIVSAISPRTFEVIKINTAGKSNGNIIIDVLNIKIDIDITKDKPSRLIIIH